VPFRKHPEQVKNPYKERPGEDRKHGKHNPYHVVFNRTLHYATYSVKYVYARNTEYQFEKQRKLVHGFKQIVHTKLLYFNILLYYITALKNVKKIQLVYKAALKIMQYKRPLCASTVKQAAIKTKQNTTTAATFSGKDNAFFYSLKICTKKFFRHL